MRWSCNDSELTVLISDWIAVVRFESDRVKIYSKDSKKGLWQHKLTIWGLSRSLTTDILLILFSLWFESRFWNYILKLLRFHRYSSNSTWKTARMGACAKLQIFVWINHLFKGWFWIIILEGKGRAVKNFFYAIHWAYARLFVWVVKICQFLHCFSMLFHQLVKFFFSFIFALLVNRVFFHLCGW